MTRKELTDYCLSFANIYEDYPFDRIVHEGAWTVMRHQSNKKSFALIYERNEKLCINLKCDPFEADFLRQAFKDVTPAYHMNKVHWNTVNVEGDVPNEELLQMISRSYDLTKSKREKG